MKTLDYEIIQDGEEWQVWTPDKTGAVIGLGEDARAALFNAIESLRATADEMSLLPDPR